VLLDRAIRVLDRLSFMVFYRVLEGTVILGDAHDVIGYKSCSETIEVSEPCEDCDDYEW